MRDLISPVQDLAPIVAALVKDAQRRNHRHTLVLAGARPWCVRAAQRALQAVALETVLWITTEAPEGTWSLPAIQAQAVLGREVDAVVFDTYSGFDLDAFGAISGTVRGGGLLLLLTPNLDEWPYFADPEYARVAVALYPPEKVTGRFLHRLARVIQATQEIRVVEEGGETLDMAPSRAELAEHGLQSPLLSEEPNEASTFQASDPEEDIAPTLLGAICRTEDQRQAVEAILRVARGHRRRPVVLTSDRGRGKSSALGIAAAQLLGEGTQHVVVTGPRLDAVTPVFEQAHRMLPEAHTSRATLYLGAAGMEFVPPDRLLHTPVRAELLLVDEAAAIPTPMLERLLQRYPRIAFATTIHGYEGTGRGFTVRFNQRLDQHTRGWRALRLETPIRWAPEDPLERFVFRALLLDASPAADPAVEQATLDRCQIERVDREALVCDETRLSELFGLLVLAHYRTRPYDLRYLLDGPNLSVYVISFEAHVIGTALVAREGGFDAQASRRIWAGRTRPHGHLLPESLAAHVGLAYAPQLWGARVMRIAVHPAVQGRGLGTHLVAAVVAAERDAGIDYVGSSFGATDELLRFWMRCGFLPVRLGVRRGATSGAHSAIVLQALSTRGEALVAEARKRFLNALPHLLADPLRELEPELAIRLLRWTGVIPPPELDHQDWLDLVSFAFGHRLYEMCIAPLWKLVCTALADAGAAEVLGKEDKAALVLKVLQRRSWKEVTEVLEMPGRADVIALLRCAMRSLVLHYGDEHVKTEAQRLIT